MGLSGLLNHYPEWDGIKDLVVTLGWYLLAGGVHLRSWDPD